MIRLRHPLRLLSIALAAITLPVGLYWLLLVQDRQHELEQRNLRLLSAVGTEAIDRLELLPKIAEYLQASNEEFETALAQAIARSVGATRDHIKVTKASCTDDELLYWIDPTRGVISVLLPREFGDFCPLAELPIQFILDDQIVEGALDHVALVDSMGQVIEQAGLRPGELASVSGLHASESELPELSSDRGAAHEGRNPVDRWSKSPLALSVEFAGGRHRLFSVPLPELAPCEGQLPEKIEAWACANRVRGYALVSTVSERRFDTATQSVSPNLLALGGLALLLLLLAWPYLKVRFTSDREGIRVGDFLFMAASTVLGPSLIGVALLDYAAYELLAGAYDRTSEDIGETAESGVLHDLRQAEQTVYLLGAGLAPHWSGEGLGTNKSILPGCPTGRALSKSLGSEEPLRCRVFGLSHLGTPEIAFFVHSDGKWASPRVLWRDRDVSPVPVSDRNYFKQADSRDLWTLPRQRPAEEKPTLLFAETLRARDEGTMLTVVAIPIESGPRASANRLPSVGAIGTRLASVWSPVLPPGFALAVINDATGEVVQHSTEGRVLVENMFDETGGLDSAFARAVSSRDEEFIDSTYRGVSYRAHIRPIQGIPWTIVVLREKAPLQLANLQVTLTTLGHMAIQIALVALLIVGARIVGSRTLGLNLAFPNPELTGAYKRSAWAMGFLCVHYVIAAVALDGALLAAVLIPSGGVFILTSSWIVKGTRANEPSRGERLLVASSWILALGGELGWLILGLWTESAEQVALWVASSVPLALAALIVVTPPQALHRPKSLPAPPMAPVRLPFVMNGFLIVIGLGLIPSAAILKDSLHAETLRIQRAAQVGFGDGLLERASNALKDYRRLHNRTSPYLSDPIAGFSMSTVERAQVCRGAHGWKRLGVVASWVFRPAHGQPTLEDCSTVQLTGPLEVSRQRPDPWSVPFTALLTGAVRRDARVPNDFDGTATRSEPLVRWRWDRPENLLTSSEDAVLVHRDHGGSEVLRVAAVDTMSPMALIAAAVHGDQLLVLGRVFIALSGLVLLLWLAHRLVSWTASAVLGVDISPFPLWPRPIPITLDVESRSGADQVPSRLPVRVLLVRPEPNMVAPLARELAARARNAAEPKWLDLRFPVETKEGPSWVNISDLKDNDVVVLRHAESAIADPRRRRPLLRLLEELIARESVSLLIETESSPLALVSQPMRSENSRLERVNEAELLRWANLVQALSKERCIGTHASGPAYGTADLSDEIEALVARECAWSPSLASVREIILVQLRAVRRTGGATHADRDQVIEAVRDRAEATHRRIWATCSLAEKRVLLRLAEGFLVHPQNRDVLRGLLRRGIVVRAPAFRIVSASLARFVRNAETSETVRAWETDSEATAWRDLRVALPIFFAVSWVVISAASSEALHGLQGYVPIALGAAGAFVQFLNTIRGSSSSLTTLASAPRSNLPT